MARIAPIAISSLAQNMAVGRLGLVNRLAIAVSPEATVNSPRHTAFFAGGNACRRERC